jgi:prepilin-type N-terminal cleavage/methylation domain-containing protein
MRERGGIMVELSIVLTVLGIGALAYFVFKFDKKERY